jgi:uncharacterized membrane protein
MRASHAIFAATMIAIGVLGIVQGNFTPTWSGVSRAFPARTALAYFCAAISLGSGLGLLWKRTALIAARTLLASFLLWMLVFRLPPILRAPADSGAWWAAGDTAVMAGIAWVLCARFAGGDQGLRIARTLYGLGLIPFGVAHFTFLERTVSMVPGWLPWHLAWAIFTGCTLIAAGVAVVIDVRARLAAMLVTLELALFTLLVWVPVIVRHPTASDWAEFVSSCVLTVSAWVVADSYRRSARVA